MISHTTINGLDLSLRIAWSSMSMMLATARHKQYLLAKHSREHNVVDVR